MSKPAPKLMVSTQSLNVATATKHSTAQNQKEAATSAKNASHPSARGGYKRRRRKGGGGVPTLSVTSGPPKSKPSAQGNIIGSHKTNAALVAAGANDSKVEAPKCPPEGSAVQGGGGNTVMLGRFLESLQNINKTGGSKRKRSRRRQSRRHARRTRKKRKRRRRRRTTRRKRRTRRRKRTRTHARRRRRHRRLRKGRGTLRK